MEFPWASFASATWYVHEWHFAKRMAITVKQPGDLFFNLYPEQNVR
jgi:hypothetical protein